MHLIEKPVKPTSKPLALADRQACSRYGINVSEILELVELAIGSKPTGQNAITYTREKLRLWA